MAARIEDNADEFIRSYDKLTPKRKRHVLVLANNRDYAKTLHDRLGYYVFNDDTMLEKAQKWIVAMLESGMDLTDRNIENALEAAGLEEVVFLRSYTSRMRPPVRAGQGSRRAHPGGWADVTSNLANSYSVSVNGRRVGG